MIGKRIKTTKFSGKLASVVLLVSFILGIGFNAVLEEGKPNVSPGRNVVTVVHELNYQGEIERLSRMFTEKGSRETYRFFAENYRNYTPGPVHDLAHWIGGELYKRERLQGILICDEAYSWGCHHGFITVALTQEGRDILPKIEESCRQNQRDELTFGGCIHGVGHGLLSLEGYKEKGLLESLVGCDLLSTPEVSEGCYNGIFMEYNLRTMERLEGGMLAEPREYDPQDPFEPCNSLPEKYQVQCFAELPDWWRQVLNNDFEQIGKLCNKLRDRGWEECFKGVGLMAPISVDYDKNKIKRLCKLMPGEKAQAYCFLGVVEALNYEKRLDPLEFCQDVDTNLRKVCTERVR